MCPGSGRPKRLRSTAFPPPISPPGRKRFRASLSPKSRKRTAFSTAAAGAIRPGDILSAAQLDFLQASILSETDTVAALSYLPVYKGGRLGSEEILYLSLRGTKNQPPVARDSRAETYKNLPVTAALDCEDPEGDILIYTLKMAPGRGQVVFNRDGTYTYTPNREKVGTDRFTYTVEDSAGNVSEEASVEITILKPTVSGVFADMAGDPQEFEARFLREEGLFSGEEIGGVLCFCPDKPVSEEEYLLMLMKLTGLEPDERPPRKQTVLPVAHRRLFGRDTHRGRRATSLSGKPPW